MKNYLVLIIATSFFILNGLRDEWGLYAQTVTTVNGIVYHDKDENGLYDPLHDEPLEGVAVSNGRDVVVSDSDGVYQLPLKNNSFIFVIKPRNWVVPFNEKQVPHFYYLHSPGGVSGRIFEGLAPTGTLPKSVNFPLYPSEEPDKFDVLVFGDTQPRNEKEVYYISQDVIPELIGGVDAAFGITLGDVVFNDLDMFGHLTSVIAKIGIPWWYVLGNHDVERNVNNTQARAAWYKSFGPSYYSFSYGSAHFIVLDNIQLVEGEENYYKTGLGKDQMEFLKNELSRLKKNQLVIFLAHIPYEGSTDWLDKSEKNTFYKLIANHPRSFSLIAHTHQHYHQFIDKEHGFPGVKPHHMISVGAVCGAWYKGAPDEYGIPHAMMMDGTPKSYAFLHIDGNSWKLSWKASRRPEEFQMYINSPDCVSVGTDKIKVTANIFNALPSAKVRIKIGKEAKWIDMERSPQYDKTRLDLMEKEKQLGEVPWRNLAKIKISKHIWQAELEIPLNPGTYVIRVKAIDEWHEFQGIRLLHVK